MALASPSTALQPRPVRRRRWPWVLLALALVLLALVPALADAGWLRGPLERRVEAATGRDARIGALAVDWGWPPRVIVTDVALANADWASDQPMLRARRIAFELSPWPLLRGDLVLPSLELVKPELLLERAEDGRANWQFEEQREDRGEGVAIGALRVDQGVFRLREAARDTDLQLAVDSGQGDALLLAGDGRYRARPFTLEGSVDPPATLRDGHYGLDLTARAGATVASLRGDIEAPLNLREFTVQLALRGPTLQALQPLLDLSFPDTPPYAIEGQLARIGETWRYRDFSGTVGDSDLSGRVTVDLSGQRPHLEAKLKSDRLDFDDLGPVIGGAPGTGPDETATPEQVALAAERAREGRLLPAREFQLQALRAMDANVTLDAAQVVTRKAPISAMSVSLELRDGMLRLDPLSFAAGGGRLTGEVRLDASGDPIATEAALRVRGLELPKLFPDSSLGQRSLGTIAADIEVEGQGNSVAAMLASADGQAAAAMGQGRVSNLVLELAGLDIAEALAFLLTDDRTVPVRCAFADFAIEDGTMQARALVFDTTDTIIHGEGVVDLARERLHLTLHPRPRDTSIAALRVPLEVSGSLRDPDVSPKGGQLALRALAGAALYAIAPPAALLALVETGPGRSTDCGRAAELRTAEAEPDVDD